MPKPMKSKSKTSKVPSEVTIDYSFEKETKGTWMFKAEGLGERESVPFGSNGVYLSKALFGELPKGKKIEATYRLVDE